jgi:hypothetical protein
MWIITAWQCISPAVNVQAFKKCCISNAMDKTDDDMLWNGSEENGDVRRECDAEKDGGRDTDWYM